MADPNPRELAGLLRKAETLSALNVVSGIKRVYVAITPGERDEIAAALERGADAIDALAEAITYVAHDKRCPADLRRECSCGLDGFLSGFGE